MSRFGSWVAISRRSPSTSARALPTSPIPMMMSLVMRTGCRRSCLTLLAFVSLDGDLPQFEEGGIGGESSCFLRGDDLSRLRYVIITHLPSAAEVVPHRLPIAVR